LERLCKNLCSDPDIILVFGCQDWEEHGKPITAADVLTEILTSYFPNTSAILMQSMTDFLCHCLCCVHECVCGERQDVVHTENSLLE
jgi:hypothetical protein